MPRHRAVKRIAETQSPPRVRVGRGFGDPFAQQARLVDMMIDPAVRKGSTVTSHFPSRAALVRSKPLSLNSSDGSLRAMTGQFVDGTKKVG